MIWKRENLFLLLWLAVFIMFVAIASGYNSKARMVPLVVGIPGIVLAAVELARSAREKKPEMVEVEEGEEPMTVQELHRREISMLLWIALLFLLLWLVGFLYTIPLYMILFIRARSREGWPLAIGMALGSWAFLHFLFVQFLKIQLYPGLIFSMFS